MTNPNDRVFPSELSINSSWIGLTKREYFAACALQGLLSSSDGELINEHPERIAVLAVEAANSLIKQLNKKD